MTQFFSLGPGSVFSRFLMFIWLSVFCLSGFAQDLRIELEEPADGGVASGVSNIRGWAIASEGVSAVEIFIDGELAFEIPYGGERKDVENIYPDVPNSLYSGFGQTWNYGVMTAGTHAMTARAISSSGTYAESSAQFTVARLPESFYPEESPPSLQGATARVDEQSEQVIIEGLALPDGDKKRVVLEWQTASQSFQVQSVATELGGFNMLLIGNSFFRPYAKELGDLALDAGFSGHQDTGVFAGGDNGRPINLWEADDDLTNQIKETLDQGNIDIFGMTAGVVVEDPTRGFREWIDYALTQNPDITIFISLAPPDFPDTWPERAEELGYTNIRDAYMAEVVDLVHGQIIDVLRLEFPSTHIFSIPTYGATFDLADLYDQGLLLDDINFRGAYRDSLFTDEKGHQGKIVVTTGTLIWLSALYGVDLTTNDFDTGFNTDLHSIAESVINSHDPNY